MIQQKDVIITVKINFYLIFLKSKDSNSSIDEKFLLKYFIENAMPSNNYCY